MKSGIYLDETHLTVFADAPTAALRKEPFSFLLYVSAADLAGGGAVGASMTPLCDEVHWDSGVT